ncbi:MAG: hypothetical protein K6A89_05595 [Treponema sp.]|nr:hypothetical protein [Treponema sp.]
MKKIVTVLFSVLISVAAFAQNLPEFTEADNAYVFDAKQLKEDFGDACKIELYLSNFGGALQQSIQADRDFLSSGICLYLFYFNDKVIMSL